MLWGRYASNASEARYPQLWRGRVFGVCPSVQGPTGLNLYDTTGRGRHGTLTNMDAPTDWVLSQGLYSLDFDGTNDYVGGFRNIQVSAGLTISAWFAAGSTSKVRHSIYFGSNADQSPDIYAHIEQVSGTTYAPNLYLSNGYVGVGTSFTLDSVWHHYAWTLSADAATVRYYQDGKSLGTVANSRTILQDNDSGSIGGSFALISLGFTALGKIDDVARYSRELTAGEIRLLARRRGIAYEARRDVFGWASFSAYWARRQNQIIGGGV